jgi:hypothetical protein
MNLSHFSSAAQRNFALPKRSETNLFLESFESLAKFLGQPFGASSFQLLHSAAERPKVAVLSMVLPA